MMHIHKVNNASLDHLSICFVMIFFRLSLREKIEPNYEKYVRWPVKPKPVERSRVENGLDSYLPQVETDDHAIAVFTVIA